MTLRSHLVLQRAPNLDLHLDASNQLRIQIDGRIVACDKHGLAVLDAFAQPTSLQAGLDKLKARGSQHWMELTSVVIQLYEDGILRDSNQTKATPHVTASGWGAAPIHVMMLNDQVRTSRFLEGIRHVVRQGDIVVEIGTGTGVLAIAAARAGASRVYAIEASAVADVAASIFTQNALADRITLLRGWSSEIEIPERADVFISETIGDDPLAEQILEITRDARQRLLKPDARFIPSTLAVLGLPVTIPKEELSKRMATAESLDRWRAWYDIDFTPLTRAAEVSPYPLFHIGSQEAAQWPSLAEPVLLSEFDLTASDSAVIDHRIEVQAAQTGLCNGLLVYFEARLGPAITFCTHPARASVSNAWSSPVWYFGDSLSVQRGDRFTLHYRYGHSGTSSQVRLLPDK